MSETIWAQIIAGAFGVVSVVLGTYLPYRLRRSDERRNKGNGASPNGGEMTSAPKPPQPEISG
jgi:hypothetical protein